MSQLPDYVQFKAMPASDFKDIFTAATDDVIDILRELLRVDPNKRCTCQQVRPVWPRVTNPSHSLPFLPQALRMPYFVNRPRATPGHLLPRVNSTLIKDETAKHGTKRKLEGQEPGNNVLCYFCHFKIIASQGKFSRLLKFCIVP